LASNDVCGIGGRQNTSNGGRFQAKMPETAREMATFDFWIRAA
jgi:hypothetical protein